MSTKAEPEVSHAEKNAIGWLETIREYANCLEVDRDRLEELRDERDHLKDMAENPGDHADSGKPDQLKNEYELWADENAEELAALESAVTVEGEELDADACRERVQESVLSVEVRGDWYTPGHVLEGGPSEFMILLSTGGPALRIVGDLGDHCEPTRARLEYQDWGTPWTEKVTTGSDHDALMTFVRCFYFGE